MNVRPGCGLPEQPLEPTIVAFDYKAGKATMTDVLYPTDGIDQPTIGIDVSKKSLDIAGSPDLRESVPNTVLACRRLAKQLVRISPRVVAVEATGGYERILVRALWDLDLPVAIIQPSRVRAHARSAGQLAKTDRLDASSIAGFARSMPIRFTRRYGFSATDAVRSSRTACERSGVSRPFATPRCNERSGVTSINFRRSNTISTLAFES